MARILSSAVLIFLLWASAVIVLGGVANIQKQCEDTFTASSSRRSLLASARTTCGTTYSLAWWIIALQVTCNLLAVAAAFSPNFRAAFSNSIAHFFTAVTVLLMYISSTLYPMLKLQLTSGTKMYTIVEVTLAGAIILMIVNFIYIFLAAASSSFQPTLTTAEANTPNHTPRSPDRDMKVTISTA